jgi:hypothetical protein
MPFVEGNAKPSKVRTKPARSDSGMHAEMFSWLGIEVEEIRP